MGRTYKDKLKFSKKKDKTDYEEYQYEVNKKNYKNKNKKTYIDNKDTLLEDDIDNIEEECEEL